MAQDYNKQFKMGDRIILELNSKEIFEGIYADGGKHRIVLTEVVQHNNKNKLGDFYEFYSREIAKIHLLKLPPTKEVSKSAEQSHSDCKVIKVCEEEYFRLKEMSRNFVYIDNVDKRYYEAIKILGDSETIGIVSLGMEKHRSGSLLNLLVICTWQQVYIFDLINVEKRKLYPELSKIFESEYICKVIHKSACLVDILYRQYGVYVQNTFDTLLVDLMLQKRESGKCLSTERSLSDCLVHYLHFPGSILESALDVSQSKWTERPLTDKLKLHASQLATYLILLKEHLQKELLKDVYESINRVQDYVYKLDDFHFLNYNSKTEVSKGIQQLIPKLQSLSIEDSKL